MTVYVIALLHRVMQIDLLMQEVPTDGEKVKQRGQEEGGKLCQMYTEHDDR